MHAESASCPERGMPKILLLGGPSGSGKSTFSSQYLTARNWLHLEIDRWPEMDGIDHYGIRAEWNRFLEQNDPIPLHEVLRQRAIGHAGLVLSLPSPVVFDSQHTAILQNDDSAVIAYRVNVFFITTCPRCGDETKR